MPGRVLWDDTVNISVTVDLQVKEVKGNFPMLSTRSVNVKHLSVTKLKQFM